jgi:hypothetical protein
MDRNQVLPHNNRAGKLYESLTVPGFLFIPHQQFPEPVHPRITRLQPGLVPPGQG